jgi:hypothetical protein
MLVWCNLSVFGASASSKVSAALLGPIATPPALQSIHRPPVKWTRTYLQEQNPAVGIWDFFYALLIVQSLSGWIPLYSRRISHQRSRRAEAGIDIAVSELIIDPLVPR